MFRTLMAAAFAGTVLFIAAAQARADVPLPACDDAAVLHAIAEKQDYADRRLDGRGLRVIAVERTRQTFRSGGEQIGTIARRGCSARAVMSEGRPRSVRYVIEADTGFAGNGYRVQSCIAGLDRWNVFSGDCRTLAQW
ncbi:MAG: hypothetical protein KDI98_10800 [Hyphomicrobiaceae bacterium]|nr:hypothetical protein [Hyphomicrobiaceae bacterium]